MILFFDIDGTLLNFDNEIREKTVEAIQTARKNGHKCFLNSGRSRAFIQNEELLSIGFDGIVSGCGTMIEYDGDVIFKHLVSKEDAQHTVDTIRAYGFKAMLEGPEYIYLTKSDFADDIVGNKLFEEIATRIADIDEYRNRWDIQKLICITEVPLKERDKCFAELSDIYKFIIHSDTVCEMVPKEYDKGTGVRMVCKLLGEDVRNTFAFGDGINDREMFLTAGVGVGMGGTKYDLTPYTDYITEPMEEDGIWKAMKHFDLI